MTERTYQPLSSTANLARGDTRDTVAREIVGINRGEEEITSINGEGLATERQGD